MRPNAKRETNRQHDAKRRAEQPWRAWYKTPRWQRARATQLSAYPLCAMCQEDGVITPANVCDHVEPHRGNEAKFWAGPFQSLCEPCHNRHKQREERGGARSWAVGEDGWPIARHRQDRI